MRPTAARSLAPLALAPRGSAAWGAAAQSFVVQDVAVADLVERAMVARRFVARFHLARASSAARVVGKCLLASAAFAPACHVVDAKTWNLKELHDEADHHRYTGALESDIEFFFRHKVAGALLANAARIEQKGPSAIEDPASACLENLIELEDFSDKDPWVAGLQVEWFARLAVSDPWKLSRERAVHALARAGARLKAGVPTALPKEATPAGPAAIGEAIAGLVRAATPMLKDGSRASASQRLDFDAACQVVEELTLDLDGARRALHVAADIAHAFGRENPVGEPVRRLSEDLQRRCVRQALAAALFDKVPLVRAAAVEASVKCAGPSVLDAVLVQLEREESTEVLVRVLDLVRSFGLSSEPPAESGISPEQAREVRLRAIYELLDRPEASVRVAAMRALASVEDTGPRSMREEDWQSWWLSRREKHGS